MVYKDFTSLSAKALLTLIFAGSILLAGCKSQEVQTHWSAEPVLVDGKMPEWEGVPTTYFEDSGVLLGLCNDSENLYVLFRFNDPKWARAIRMGGLTLWLDNSGKKKKDFGIRYTGGPPLLQMQRPGMTGEGGFWESLTPEQRERLMQRRARADQITVILKKGDQAINIPADGSSGPAVSFATPQDIYTYEFRVPLKKSDVFDYGIGAEPGQTISLGLEWGGIRMGDRQRGGGRGGMGGGRRGGSGSGGSRGGSRMQPPKKQEIWVKTQLASAPELKELK
ncbi:hypothetical protein ISS37_01160 [candidate division KSB1 bacterium]|nr:hypothetical protein [candidate division KSB1 bacterium]